MFLLPNVATYSQSLYSEDTIIYYKVYCTYINANKVNIRDNSNTNSKVITQVNVGTLVEIMRVVNEENVISHNSNKWYEIKFKEVFMEIYNEKSIYGEFLEPVEKYSQSSNNQIALI
nr:SH3 domain-containing protein [Bacteroides sp. 224]